MKFNWGHGIAIFITLFVIGLVFLVVKSMNVRYELVAEDYYPKELNYQSEINRLNNAARFGELELEQIDKRIKVSLPDTFATGNSNGFYYLYCPSDSRQDLSDTLILENDHVFWVPIDNSKKLKYEVQVDLVFQGEGHLYKKSIFLK